MYVLQPRDPECQLKNELIHTYDETFRLDGAIAVVQTENARTFLIRKRGFLDITEKLLDRKGAAEALGVTIPNVDRWVQQNQLKAYGEGKKALFTTSVVQEFKTKREEKT